MTEKQYDFKSAQTQAREQWAQEKTYQSSENKPLFSIDTPPPTVSGSLHIGHIFSYTQTDILARYKRMQGFSVFYPFGFDDNGLATERFVEKKLDIRAHTMARSEFIALCLRETHEAEEQFKQLWQDVGLSVNWDYCYSTISASTRKIAQQSFIELYKKGFIYRKHEPALYCTACRTSVAQAELDDVEKPSFFNDIVFQDEEGNDLIIGTTRPELLSSCVALLYNPADERYHHLKNKKAVVPIFNYSVPILQDESVVIEKGTGLVMCCTFGDKTDIEWYKKFKLPYKQSIGLDGKWGAETTLLAGLNATQARATILEALKRENLLLNQKPITHAVNVHERCKKEIEYVALSQWFLNILEHKKAFITLADEINWYPAFMKARYTNWVENISWDWCLSRQRFYGIPFPVWHCLDCNNIILADASMLPVDPQETRPQNCTCGSAHLAPDTDVMDTWNTSSLTPYICYGLRTESLSPFSDAQVRNFIPMSMRPQAHDIIRTWAFYTIVKSWMHHGTIPWKDIVISGHVLADSKEKLSKSKDSGKLSPQTLLDQYSADVVRYWTASGTLGHDTAFSETQLKIGQRLVTKLWNAFKFVHEHTQQVPPAAPTHFNAANAWLLHEASETFAAYQKALDEYDYSSALHAVEKFFWNSFCDNYVEIIKHQFFNAAAYEPATIEATRWTLHHVGLRLLQMYAPYLPYITETIYRELYKNKTGVNSVHQTEFARHQPTFVFNNETTVMQSLIAVVAEVRKLKTERQLSLKTPLETLTIALPEHAGLLQQALEKEAQLIKGVCQATSVTFVTTQGTTELVDKGGAWHAMVMINP